MIHDILTTDEVADLLQCDVETVELKLRQGELPGIKPGRSWMCPRQALLDSLNQQALANIKPVSRPKVAVPNQRPGTQRTAPPSLIQGSNP